MAITMVVMMAFASLAVDYGRAQIAKTELRRAADAAARAGVSYLGDSTAVKNAAVAMAANNTCAGDAVQINSNTDVELGTWDTTARVFTPLTVNTSSADSVRVTCARTAARGNAIPLMFGWIIGQQSCDVQAQSVVRLQPSGYGLVGLNYIKMSGNSSMSYWSSSGTVAGNQGNIVSNGDVTSSGSASIDGTVWTQSGKKTTGVKRHCIQNAPQA